VTVWNQQDWTWRLTAIVGLALSIVPPVSGYCWLTLTPWGSPVSAPSDLLSWTASDTRFVVKWCVGVLSLWLLMLVRRKWGWLWGGLWALLGAAVAALLTLEPLWIGWTQDSATELAAALGIAALVSSQIWLTVAGTPTRHRESRASGKSSEHGSAALWRCAAPAWALLVLIGGFTALAGVVVVAVHWPWPLWQLPLAAWVPLVAIGLGLVLLAGVVVLLWRELILSGRTWLWWLVLWASCLVVIVIMLPSIVVDWKRLQADSPFTLDDLEQLIGAGFFAATAFLLAAAQIWVALKARQLQSGQVGLDTH